MIEITYQSLFQKDQTSYTKKIQGTSSKAVIRQVTKHADNMLH